MPDGLKEFWEIMKMEEFSKTKNKQTAVADLIGLPVHIM